MRPGVSRRRFLRLAAGTSLSGLAGCARSSDGAGTPTVTPAPIPSAQTPTTSAPGGTPPPSAATLDFEVRVRSGFSETSPARLEIAVQNAGRGALYALGGTRFVLPFVDDDYAGVDREGDRRLFLAPDDAGLTIAPREGEPGPLEEFLPTAPDDGCWSLPFDWPAAWGPQTATSRSIAIRAGETLRHGYGLYFIDDCSAGSFTFSSSFELSAGEPPVPQPPARARLEFVVTVQPDQALDVQVQPPMISAAAGSDG